MPTRKELIESLSDEINNLAQSVDNNSQISDSIIQRMESLKSDLERILSKGAEDMGKSIFMGNVAGGLISSVIQTAIENRNSDPHMIIAKRTYRAIHIIIDAYKNGDRKSYMGTLKLLKVYDFTHDQAVHILDLLLNKCGVLRTYEDDNGKEFIMVDEENEAFQKLNEGYKNNIYTYLTCEQPGEYDDEETEDE